MRPCFASDELAGTQGVAAHESTAPGRQNSRRSATANATPSWYIPVMSQHEPSPRRVAPWTTKPRLRRADHLAVCDPCADKARGHSRTSFELGPTVSRCPGRVYIVRSRQAMHGYLANNRRLDTSHTSQPLATLCSVDRQQLIPLKHCSPTTPNAAPHQQRFSTRPACECTNVQRVDEACLLGHRRKSLICFPPRTVPRAAPHSATAKGRQPQDGCRCASRQKVLPRSLKCHHGLLRCRVNYTHVTYIASRTCMPLAVVPYTPILILMVSMRLFSITCHVLDTQMQISVMCIMLAKARQLGYKVVVGGDVNMLQNVGSHCDMVTCSQIGYINSRLSGQTRFLQLQRGATTD